MKQPKTILIGSEEWNGLNSLLYSDWIAVYVREKGKIVFRSFVAQWLADQNINVMASYNYITFESDDDYIKFIFLVNGNKTK